MSAKQERLIYDLNSGAPNLHPQWVMGNLADQLGFRLLGAVPQSIADQWWFWVEYETKPALPSFLRKASWLPVGST